MSDLATTRADTLTNRARGTHLVADFTRGPSARNGWQTERVHIDGVVDAVRVYGHGSVRVVVDGVSHFIAGTARVQVEPHLRVPDSPADLPQVAPPAAASTVDPENVRREAYGERIAATALTAAHVGSEVEFTFRGTRFYGVLTAATDMLGMVAVTLDGAERFLFDDEQTVLVRPAPVVDPPLASAVRPTSAAPMQVAPIPPAPAVADPAPAMLSVPVAAPPSAGAWVPVPEDELEFV